MTAPAANPSSPLPGKPARVMPPPKAAPDPRLSALSLLDEAAHRLRAAPAGTLGIYYAATLPFVLALLYFWADMSRSADAADREAAFALGLAFLFVVMKTGHAVFAARLRAQFAGRALPRWTFGRLARAGLVQATWQPTSLFVLPAAVALAFPLGWACAFYHNLSVCGDGEPSERHPVARAWRHTVARPGQNHRALGVLWGMEFLAWLALMVTMFTVPALLKMFTGEDNAFTRGGGFGLLFNSTFLAVSVALVYLAFNPFAKTFYALRCFYADAQASGEDLLSELRALPPVGRPEKSFSSSADPTPAPTPVRPAAALSPAMRAVLAGALLAAAFPVAGRAADAPAPTPAPAPHAAQNVSPGTMDRSVRDVLNRREFTWRNPRPATAPEDSRPGVIARFFKALGDQIAEWFRTLRRWLGSDKPSPAPSPQAPSGSGGGVSLRLILYLLVALCAVGLLALLYQAWRTRRSARALAGKAISGAPAAASDLTDESVLADQLPEDEWLALARRLLARGEHRLALRAFYLSTLSGLGGRGLLGIARHKSNRDYQGELRRRARDRAGLQETFARLVGRFERVWYGSYPADDGLLADFQDDRERLTAELAAPVPG